MLIKGLGLVAAVAALSVLGTLAAPAAEYGAEAFQERCAVCHGPTGAGDGLVGELFAQKPKDLTALSRENGGQFPWVQTAMAIDGRTEIAAHGGTEMPIWGEYLMVDALEDRQVNPKDARSIVNGRIIELTFYIMSLQVE